MASTLKIDTVTTPDGTGNITFSRPIVADVSNVTGTLPAIDGSNLTNLPGGGKILQVVATEITATVTMTSSSYIDLTGMTVDITPTAASSKILVSVTGSASCSHGDNAKFKLVRLVNSASATDVHVGDAAGSRTRAFYGWGETTSTHSDTVSTQFLDSPSYSLTDELTYKVQWTGYAVSRVNTWNRTSTDTDNANFYRGASSIIAWEIAA